MSVKRSRVESSTELNAESAETPRSKMLNYASSASEPGHIKVASFLERCYYCKKRLAPNAEIYMYSNFCAFCSIECRDVQMAIDQAAMKKIEGSNKK